MAPAEKGRGLQVAARVRWRACEGLRAIASERGRGSCGGAHVVARVRWHVCDCGGERAMACVR
eukprot:5630860-Pleurochrysis_carterae.AAC.2